MSDAWFAKFDGSKPQTHYNSELGMVTVPGDVCPFPIGDDDGSVRCCVGSGHCGCKYAKAKLGE